MHENLQQDAWKAFQEKHDLDLESHVYWEDLDYLARIVKKEDHFVDVELFEVGSTTHSTGSEYTPMLNFMAKEYSTPNDIAESLDDAEVVVGFYVKWDGCCEMYPNQMHFCGAGGIVGYAEALRRSYKWAATKIKRLDTVCADMDLMEDIKI